MPGFLRADDVCWLVGMSLLPMEATVAQEEERPPKKLARYERTRAKRRGQCTATDRVEIPENAYYYFVAASIRGIKA